MQRRFFGQFLSCLKSTVDSTASTSASESVTTASEVLENITKQMQQNSKRIGIKQKQFSRQQESFLEKLERDRQPLYNTLLNLKETSLLQFQAELQKSKEELLSSGYTESRIEYMQRMLTVHKCKQLSRLSYSKVVQKSRNLMNVPNRVSPFTCFLATPVETRIEMAKLHGVDWTEEDAKNVVQVAKVWKIMSEEQKKPYMEVSEKHRQEYSKYKEEKSKLLTRETQRPIIMYIKSRTSELASPDPTIRRQNLTQIVRDYNQLPEAEKTKFKNAYLDIRMKNAKEKKAIIRELQEQETQKLLSVISSKSFKK